MFAGVLGVQSGSHIRFSAELLKRVQIQGGAYISVTIHLKHQLKLVLYRFNRSTYIKTIKMWAQVDGRMEEQRDRQSRVQVNGSLLMY